MCPIPSAASASARGGNGGRSGAEAGGGDACLEMRKVRRGCIVDDGSGSRVLGVSIPMLCYHYRCSSVSRKGKEKDAYEL